MQRSVVPTSATSIVKQKGLKMESDNQQQQLQQQQWTTGMELERIESKRMTKRIVASRTSSIVFNDPPLPSILDEKEEINKAKVNGINGSNSSSNNNMSQNVTRATNRKESVSNRDGDIFDSSSYQPRNNGSYSSLHDPSSSILGVSSIGSFTGSGDASPQRRRNSSVTIFNDSSTRRSLIEENRRTLTQKQQSNLRNIDPITNTLMIDEDKIDDEDEEFETKDRNRKTNTILSSSIDPTGLGMFILSADERKLANDNDDENDDDDVDSDLPSTIGRKVTQRMSLSHIGKLVHNGKSDKNMSHNQETYHSPSKRDLHQSISSVNSMSTISASTISSPHSPEQFVRPNRRISVTTVDSVYPVREHMESFEVMNPSIGKQAPHNIAYHPGTSAEDRTAQVTRADTQNGQQTSIGERMHPYLGTLDQSYFTERRNSRVGNRQSLQLQRKSLRATQSDLDSVASVNRERVSSVSRSRSETDESMRKFISEKSVAVDDALSKKNVLKQPSNLQELSVSTIIDSTKESSKEEKETAVWQTTASSSSPGIGKTNSRKNGSNYTVLREASSKDTGIQSTSSRWSVFASCFPSKR